MKILLVSPNWKWCEEEKNVNYPFPPYNLCLLAAIVRDQKLCDDIKIVDAYVDDLKLSDKTTKLITLPPLEKVSLLIFLVPA